MTVMRVEQALVACGGKGSRLRKGGVDFSISKSFIELEGQPMLYWCLLGIYCAGIKKIVIAGDGEEKLKRAEKVLADFPHSFSKVDFYEDSGIGTFSLSYYARHLLDEYFFIECGHSMSEPGHYNKMKAMLENGNKDAVVFSCFKPTSNEKRKCVRVEGNKIKKICNLTGAKNEFWISYPALLNKKYVEGFPKFGFDKDKILEIYASKNLVEAVCSNMPIEVDLAKEWAEAVPIYKKNIERLQANFR